MIKKSILGLMLTLSLPSLASDLQDLRSQLNVLKSFTASFKQIVQDDTGEVLQTGEGQLALQQPNKISWQQTAPDETLLVSDGEKTYYFDNFAEQVSIFNSDELIKSTPFILLTSNDEKLWQQYTVTHDKNMYIVKPKLLKNAQVTALVISFNEHNHGLKNLQIQDVSGQTSFFNFSQAKINPLLTEAIFKFVIPKGVEVDDQTSN